MGKVKSAILITLFTLVIAALCFVCTVSFNYGTDGIHKFNSVLRMTDKDADLGGGYGSNGEYNGGGYLVTYYPDGVISAKEYADNLGGYADETEKADYEKSYVPYSDGTLYLNKDDVCDGGAEPSEAFKASFKNTVNLLEKRFSLLKKDGAELSVTDDYTIRAFLPKNTMNSALAAFTFNSYTGDFSVRYGSSEDAAETIMPKGNKTITDYFKKASTRTTADGTSYIVLKFTDKGREVIKEKTAESGTMYFTVGENTVIPLSVSEEIDQSTLYISGTYTAETAAMCANVINTVINTAGADDTLSLSIGESVQFEGLYGGNALTSLYIAYGVCFLAMMAFFFVRYRRLGFVHLYTYLIFTLAMILCVYGISFLYLSLETFIAFLLVSLLLSASNVITFEYAKKEYATGRTMASSVKAGYKKCFWHIFDLHIVIAVLSFITFGIGLANLSAFAFILGLGTVFSGICCLALNRLMWAIMMSFTPNKGGFCNFKREEVEDDD